MIQRLILFPADGTDYTNFVPVVTPPEGKRIWLRRTRFVFSEDFPLDKHLVTFKVVSKGQTIERVYEHRWDFRSYATIVHQEYSGWFAADFVYESPNEKGIELIDVGDMAALKMQELKAGNPGEFASLKFDYTVEAVA